MMRYQKCHQLLMCRLNYLGVLATLTVVIFHLQLFMKPFLANFGIIIFGDLEFLLLFTLLGSFKAPDRLRDLFTSPLQSSWKNCELGVSHRPSEMESIYRSRRCHWRQAR